MTEEIRIELNGWTYRTVMIAQLKPNAPFYADNPALWDVLPEYNTPGTQPDPTRIVWICYPTILEKQNLHTIE